jgi:hypothetical protein
MDMVSVRNDFFTLNFTEENGRKCLRLTIASQARLTSSSRETILRFAEYHCPEMLLVVRKVLQTEGSFRIEWGNELAPILQQTPLVPQQDRSDGHPLLRLVSRGSGSCFRFCSRRRCGRKCLSRASRS